MLTRHDIPRSCSSCFGPMPLSKRIFGVSMAPRDNIVSFLARISCPLDKTTPAACGIVSPTLVSSIILCATVYVHMLKFDGGSFKNAVALVVLDPLYVV